MEPAPEGGRNPPFKVRPPPRKLPQWSPPRKAGGTVVVGGDQPGGEGAAMEPAPEGGRNPFPKCTPADLPL